MSDKPPHVTIMRVPVFTTPPKYPTGGATAFIHPDVTGETAKAAESATGGDNGDK